MTAPSSGSVRLQKFLADAGVASRRAAEVIITEGRVSVNGRTVTELGTKVSPLHDDVQVDGTRLKPRKRLYLAVHKPRGVLSTRIDPSKRQTLVDLIPPEWSNLYPVGRLDADTEGLIFMTNDGDFCLHLTHPRYGIRKVYLATVEGKMLPQMAHQLLTGVEHEGDLLKALEIRIRSASRSTSVVELVLGEGKNREVRRMFEVLGMEVLRLQRLQIGSIKLGDLRPGRWRTLTDREIKSLLNPI